MFRTMLASVAIVTASISTTASATIQFNGGALDLGSSLAPGQIVGELNGPLAVNHSWTCRDRSPWSHAGNPDELLLTGGVWGYGGDVSGYTGDLPGNDTIFPAVLSGPTATLSPTPLLTSIPSDLGDIATEKVAEPGALALLGLAVLGLAAAWAARRARRLRKTVA